MNNHEKMSFRVLGFITTPKRADKALQILKEEKLPVQYQVIASGTASSETLDILGLGSPDRSLILSFLTKDMADKMIRKVHNELQFNIPGNGIGFTVMMNGASNHIVKMLGDISKNGEIEERKGDTMSDVKRVMIVAVVNQGYSEEVMNAAKAAGATGGTVIHGRHAGDDEVSALWGLGIQEERDIVLIIADGESKVSIMQAITTECGINTDAKGIVVSMPLDTVVGLSNPL